MGESSYAPRDPENPDDDDKRWTLEVQMTGFSDEPSSRPMPEGILTLRAPDGTEHQFNFLSGGHSREHEESWIPGLNRDSCDLVYYNIDWNSFAVEQRLPLPGFNGEDGKGSWLRLLSPRDMTDRGGSLLGGSSSGFFGIHTDGNVPGSEGCIATEDEPSERLYELLQSLDEDERPLRLNVLPPQHNFTPPNIDPEIFSGITMQNIGSIQRMGCEMRLRDEFSQIDALENRVFDDFTMTTNRAASLLYLDEPNGINRQTMLGIWDMQSGKGHPERLSSGDSNWGMSDRQFATALLRHGPEIYENVEHFLEGSNLDYEALDVRAYSVALRNYMAQETGMAIREPLDSPAADEYFAALEVPEDMFTDPEKIAFFSYEHNYRRLHEDPSSSRVNRLVESDNITPEQDHVGRFQLLSDLPFAEASAMTASLLATAEETGLDPMLAANAGSLYAAYTEGELNPDSTTALDTQRHVDIDAYNGMGMILPYVTKNLYNDVQLEMEANPESNPYDRIQASFLHAGMYEKANEVREFANAPLTPRPPQSIELMDIASNIRLSGVSVDLLDDPNADSAQPKQARFDL